MRKLDHLQFVMDSLLEVFGENGLLMLGIVAVVVLAIAKWRQGVREMAAEDLQRDDNAHESQNV
jgi:hypothetical protein